MQRAVPLIDRAGKRHTPGWLVHPRTRAGGILRLFQIYFHFFYDPSMFQTNIYWDSRGVPGKSLLAFGYAMFVLRLSYEVTREQRWSDTITLIRPMSITLTCCISCNLALMYLIVQPIVF